MAAGWSSGACLQELMTGVECWREIGHDTCVFLIFETRPRTHQISSNASLFKLNHVSLLLKQLMQVNAKTGNVLGSYSNLRRY